MTSLDFLAYLNLALKRSGMPENEQDRLWFEAKELLDRYTIDQINDMLAED